MNYTIRVGDKWKDAKGREWELYEKLPFGRCRVRTTDRKRVGELRLRDVQLEINSLTNQDN